MSLHDCIVPVLLFISRWHCHITTSKPEEDRVRVQASAVFTKAKPTNKQDRDRAERPEDYRVQYWEKGCLIPPQQHWSPPLTRWCCDASRRAQWCCHGDLVAPGRSASCRVHPQTPAQPHRPLTALRTIREVLVSTYSDKCHEWRFQIDKNVEWKLINSVNSGGNGCMEKLSLT